MTGVADEQVTVDEGAILGVSYDEQTSPPSIGPGSRIRAGTIIYDDVVAKERLQTGHHALIREETLLGENVLVGSQTVIDGSTRIGDNVSMQTGVYVPRRTEIGDRVFLGPGATLLNDMYPVRSPYDLSGPTIEEDVSIGANATILPDVTIEEKSFVAAGSVVIRDVPSETLAVGNPAEYCDLPSELRGGNDL